MNYLQKLLSEGKENLPALIRKLKGQPAIEGEVVGDLVTQSAKKIPKDIDGELVGQKLLQSPVEQRLLNPPVTSRVDDIANEVNLPKKGMMDHINDLSPTKKAIGVAGLVTAASAPLFYGESDETSEGGQSSIAARTPIKANTVESEDKHSVAKSATTGKRSVVDNALQNKAPEIESLSNQSDTLNNALEEARQKDADQGLMFGLLKAAQMGGAAIAGSKADTSYADAQLAKPDEFVRRLKEDTDTKELEDKRNPNSKISKLMQQSILALKPGANVEGLSAAQVEKIFPSLAQAINMQEGIAARKETAQLNREAMSIQRGEKKDRDDEMGKFKVQTSVDKMVNNLRNSDDYKTYQASKAAQSALDNAIATGDKTDTGSAFMLYAKIAQGDNSVVRESDMRNLAGSYNYKSPEEMFSKLSAQAAGGNFSENELVQMKKIASMIQDIKARHVKEQLSPIQARIEGNKLNANEIIDPGITREFAGEFEPKTTTIPEEKKTMALPRPQSPGATIRQKSTGKTFRVNADGQSATEI